MNLELDSLKTSWLKEYQNSPPNTVSNSGVLVWLCSWAVPSSSVRAVNLHKANKRSNSVA